ncbi:hypothetical protein Aduo_007120 [Ancylostoma duodenale]
MVHYKLTYFNGRGLGECARQLFALADQQYEDVRVTHEEFSKIKPKLPFGQMPVLEVYGQELAQSNAINRYLGRKFGFAGKTLFEEALVDSLGDRYHEYREEIRPYFFTAYGIRSYGDVDTLKKEVLLPARDKYLTHITKFLKKNPSGFLVSDSLTWADLLVAEHVSDIKDKVPEYLDGFPEVKAHMEKVQSNPKLKKWLESRPVTSF